MSLFSILSSSETQSSTSTSSTMSTLLAQIAAQKSASETTSTTSTTTTSASSVTITADAQRAAAAAADADKEASALVAELRAAFDEDYEAGSKTPDMSALSGRALALVALNEDGGFSKAEVASAKAQLRERDRASALALISSGDLTSATLITYNRQLLAERAEMSAEERALRDANPKLR